jgi:tetratricopeptide (TPR) repeat protein
MNPAKQNDGAARAWNDGRDVRRPQNIRPSVQGRILNLFLAWIVIGCAWPARADDVSAAFYEANKLYEKGSYTEAARAYENILEEGHVSSAIYFNQGNALFKSGQKGRAIAAYRQAAKLSPRDPDVRANLQFARNQASDGGGAASPTGAWIERLTLNEWTLLASLATTVLFALLIVRQLWPGLRETLRTYTLVAGAGALLLAALLGISVHREYSLQPSVVVVPEAVARRGPFDESQTAFTARDGAELMVLDAKGEWLQVSDGAGRTGWIRDKSVMRVQTPGRNR